MKDSGYVFFFVLSVFYFVIFIVTIIIINLKCPICSMRRQWRQQSIRKAGEVDDFGDDYIHSHEAVFHKQL